jgi:hypothetical protein
MSGHFVSGEQRSSRVPGGRTKSKSPHFDLADKKSWFQGESLIQIGAQSQIAHHAPPQK